jgi:hypothetical protein
VQRREKRGGGGGGGGGSSREKKEEEEQTDRPDRQTDRQTDQTRPVGQTDEQDRDEPGGNICDGIPAQPHRECQDSKRQRRKPKRKSNLKDQLIKNKREDSPMPPPPKDGGTVGIRGANG